MGPRYVFYKDFFVSRCKSNGSSLTIDSKIVADIRTHFCKKVIRDLETLKPWYRTCARRQGPKKSTITRLYGLAEMSAACIRSRSSAVKHCLVLGVRLLKQDAAILKFELQEVAVFPRLRKRDMEKKKQEVHLEP